MRLTSFLTNPLNLRGIIILNQMKIECPNCGCKYEPSWNEGNDCPICGNGVWRYIETKTNSQDFNNKAI